MATIRHDDCPEFDPKPWDKQFHAWTEKKFIMDSVPQILHRPLPGTVRRTIERLWTKASERDAAPPPEEALFLAYDPSPWKSEIHLSVTRDVPGARMVVMSGSFYSEVFDGPYNGVPGYLRAMETSLAAQQKKAKRYYFHFATCPQCALRYGHNYILALAQIAE